MKRRYFYNGIRKAFIMFFVSLLSLVFVLNTYVIARADAGTLIVEGGSFGTGGLSDFGAALLNPVSVVVAAGLMSLGLEINISEESAAQGMTRTQYCAEQIVAWGENSAKGINWFNQNIMNGLQFAQDGILYFAPQALDAIKEFGNWIISNSGDNYVEELPALDDVATATIGSFTTVYSSNYYYQQYYRGDLNATVTFLSNVPIAIFKRGMAGSWAYGLFSLEPATITYIEMLNASNQIADQATINLSAERNGVYYAVDVFWHNQVSGMQFDSNFSQITRIGSEAWDWPALINSITGPFTHTGEVGSDLPDTFWGDPQMWLDNLPSLELSDGYMGAIDAGILSDIQGELDQTKDYVIELKDYIKALEDAINETVADVPVENVEDGQIVLVPDPPLVIEPEYEVVQPTDVPEELTPVADPSIPAEPDTQIEGTTITGLQDVFPFCIPFDLYNLLNKFTATPIAPRFTFDYTVPVVNETIHYDFDFSGFNSVAAVLRTMELVAAIVGLAIATRAIFIRG